MSAIQRYLEPRIEKSSPSEVEHMQWNALRAFLHETVAQSHFHQQRLTEAGISLSHVKHPEDFRRLPLLRKSDIIEDISHRPPFGSNVVACPRDIVHLVETSGTSGQGNEQYLLSAADERALARLEAFGFCWAGCEEGALVATTFPLTTKAAGRWHQLGVRHLGGVYVPLGTYDAETKLQYLSRLPIHTLIATPSYVRRLEIVGERLGITPRSLGIKSLMVSGEPFTVNWAQEREDIWNAAVHEQYGSTQRALAWTCERGAVSDAHRGVLHTLPHLAYYEVIDATGNPVSEGEYGELVITPFSCAKAGPLVRFATGDRVRWLGAQICSCGRPFPGFDAGTVQRFDASLKVKGVNLYTETLDPVILADPVVDYEGIVRLDADGRERVVVRVEIRQDARQPEVDARVDILRSQLSKLTGVNIHVETHHGHLATNDMPTDMRKQRRWRDLRQEDS